MLPDYPRLKNEYRARCLDIIETQTAENSPPLKEIQKMTLFEGNENAIERGDGETEVIESEEHSVLMKIDIRALEECDADKIGEVYRNVAIEFAEKQERSVVKNIRDAVRKVGNETDARGGPLTPQMLFDAIDRMHVEFDENGQPTFSFLAGPGMAKTLSRLEHELASSVELQRKFETLMRRKRAEWRDREASRELVG